MTAKDRAQRAYGSGRQTRQRRAVLRCLAAHPGFVTAQTLRTRLLAEEEKIGLASVHRTLRARRGWASGHRS
jgi:Fe2+ or Zn2+ uptake regulation protein